MVVKPKETKGHSAINLIAGPLLIVFGISITVLYFASRIKPASKIDRLLKRLEKMSQMIDSKIEKGDI